jgi:hypothetical protein
MNFLNETLQKLARVKNQILKKPPGAFLFIKTLKTLLNYIYLWYNYYRVEDNP